MFDGQFLPGCPVPLAEPWRGREKLLKMVVMAIDECMESLSASARGDIPLVLCLAELDRPGRLPDLDSSFFDETVRRLEKGSLIGSGSTVLLNGKIGGALALYEASKLLQQGHPSCVVAGVDSYLTANTLTAYHERHRLKTEKNSNGFMPGEAASALLLAKANSSSPQLQCIGIGVGQETATVESEYPLRADGLVQAIKAALVDSGCTYKDLHYRITDLNGEHYSFKEASLALTRTMRVRKEHFDIWHPAECIGEVGAAIGPIVITVASAAAIKGYAPGPGVLCHFANDDGKRVALLLKQPGGKVN